jgi:hypothetical protein
METFRERTTATFRICHEVHEALFNAAADHTRQQADLTTP